MLPMKKYLSRKEASVYLTEIGFHTTYKTLRAQYDGKAEKFSDLHRHASAV